MADDNTSSSSLCNKGDVYFQEGDYVQAFSYYDKALQIETAKNAKSISNARPMKGLGQVHYQMGNTAESKACFKKAKRLLKKNGEQTSEEIAQVYELLGDVYLRKKKYDKSSERYRKANNTLKKLCKSEKKSGGEEAMKKELRPAMAQIAEKRGTAHIRRGNRAKAHKRFKEAKKFQPQPGDQDNDAAVNDENKGDMHDDDNDEVQETDSKQPQKKLPQSNFLSSNLKELKEVINTTDEDAFTKFCDMDLFSTLPTAIHRLQSAIETDDLTRDKCTVIRSTCRDHLDLQRFLVEADFGMKARLNYDEKSGASSSAKKEEVNEFLSPFSKDVCELGEVIEESILSNIGSLANLALKNSTAMKALIGSVEMYETAIAYCQEYDGQKETNRPQITSMKEAVMKQCRIDFELKSFEAFNTAIMSAADDADEDDTGSRLSATIQAATKLVGEIEPVKNLFPPNWNIDTHWAVCVSNVCSNDIIQKIGGPVCRNLPDLSTKQLRDLITWIEFFCDSLESAYPSIAGKKPERSPFDTSRGDLFHGDGKEVRVEDAMNGLAWGKNMLWEVHHLAEELYETRNEAENKSEEEEELLPPVVEDVDEIFSIHPITTIEENGIAEEETEKVDEYSVETTDTVETTTADDDKGSQCQLLPSTLSKLKEAISAPDDAFVKFCSLELFSNIPSTVDRLKYALVTEDLTENNCSLVQNTCKEHLDLQVLLIEADTRMKARLKEDEALNNNDFDTNPFASESSLSATDDEVDRFLASFVNDVWELGDFIQETFATRIGSLADLALKNPSAMQVIIETVEEYEVAIAKYQDYENQKDSITEEGEEGKGSLKIASMRDGVIKQCRMDFELKSFEVFSTVHMSAADNADKDNAAGNQLIAVIHAATKLVGEIEPVKNLFPTDWGVDIHWSLCVSNVCSNNLLQQIGGPDGHNLPELSTDQLFDFITWVEFFCGTLETAYPLTVEKNPDKAPFDSRPDLLHGDGKEVELEDAIDALAWAKNTLWGVHLRAKESYEAHSQTDDNDTLLPLPVPVEKQQESHISVTDITQEVAITQEMSTAQEVEITHEVEVAQEVEITQEAKKADKKTNPPKQPRRTTKYIRTPNDSQSQFLTSALGELREAISTPDDAFVHFCALDLFSDIRSILERLKHTLQTEDLTENNCCLVQSTCKEHLDLQILLVEADTEMKARLKEDRSLLNNDTNPFASESSLSATDEEVDKFLASFVNDVWELGEFIELTLLSRIGSFANLTLENPSAMKALIEAVEKYEVAIVEYQDYENQKEKGSLKITSIKEAVIKQCRRDFESKSVDVFTTIHIYAADNADEDDAYGSQLTATIQAATKLVGEIEPVRKCFPKDWEIDLHWSLCISNVCSSDFLQKIGGPDGHNLPELSITLLLDLITWVEFFCETFESAYPSIKEKNPGNISIESRPDLLNGDGREINPEDVMDGLAWAKNMLWEVHRLAKEEFLVQTRNQTDSFLDKIYNDKGAERSRSETADGRLITSLCEEIFAFIIVHLRTIRDHLPAKSEIFGVAACIVLSRMQLKQIAHHEHAFDDLDSCCAAANDFDRMSERIEDMITKFKEEGGISQLSESLIDEACRELVSLYSSHAVYAAQSVHIYVFEPMHESIADELFSAEWENDLTHNQLSVGIVRTIEDFRCDLEIYLSDYLLKKALDAFVTASVLFYIQSLLMKSEKHTLRTISCFNDTTKALGRMKDDIRIMREYFEGHVETMPALKRTIQKEFEVLTIVCEILSSASARTSESVNEATNFVFVLHKQFSDVQITKQFIGDLWHLVAPSQELGVRTLIESMEIQLKSLSPPGSEMRGRSSVPGLRLDEMVRKLYSQSKRRRPGKIKDRVDGARRRFSTEATALKKRRNSLIQSITKKPVNLS